MLLLLLPAAEPRQVEGSPRQGQLQQREERQGEGEDGARHWRVRFKDNLPLCVCVCICAGIAVDPCRVGLVPHTRHVPFAASALAMR